MEAMYGEGRRVSKNGEEEHTKNYGRHIRIQWLKDRVLISSLVLPCMFAETPQEEYLVCEKEKRSLLFASSIRFSHLNHPASFVYTSISACANDKEEGGIPAHIVQEREQPNPETGHSIEER
jgi:hypothetical protein